jgi:hypothetical protein
MDNVNRWKQSVERDEINLELARQSVAQRVEEYEATMQKLENVKNKLKVILLQQNEIDEEIVKVYPE